MKRKTQINFPFLVWVTFTQSLHHKLAEDSQAYDWPSNKLERPEVWKDRRWWLGFGEEQAYLVFVILFSLTNFRNLGFYSPK